MNDVEIIIEDDLPVVRLIREFDAPPEKVFRAHVDPELFAMWIGPRSLDTHIDHFDCRTGGSYRYIHRGEDGTEHGFFGSFHVVRPSTEIVQTFTYEGQPDGVALEQMLFEDLGDDRTRIVGTSLVSSFEARDAFLASGMEEGVNDGYERLDDLLAAS